VAIRVIPETDAGGQMVPGNVVEILVTTKNPVGEGPRSRWC
jgi:hypothetical protein